VKVSGPPAAAAAEALWGCPFEARSSCADPEENVVFLFFLYASCRRLYGALKSTQRSH